MLQNKRAYETPELAAGYARYSDLDPAELTILRMLQPSLPSARMLDLGVGGGRTTLHFANLVREYIGADYSEAMVRECQKRFADSPTRLAFRVCDARSMDMFAPDGFDFVLFSHNGIDYVDFEDRQKIFTEIRRVGKPGGHFCFSTHNLNWCANLFEWRRMLDLQPGSMVRTAKRLALRLWYNSGVRASTIRNGSYALVNDGAHGRKLKTFFIRPLDQLARLKSDFSEARVFSRLTGQEIKDPKMLETIGEPSLYYLCRFN